MERGLALSITRELAQHVVVLYGRGQLEKSSLLQDFFNHAPDWLRAAAISHTVG